MSAGSKRMRWPHLGGWFCRDADSVAKRITSRIPVFQDVPMDVVGLGAWCDFVAEDEYRAKLTAMGVTGRELQEDIQEFKRSASFRLSEFAVLADGGRLTLHDDERGFNVWNSSGDPWRYLTLEGVEAGVRTTLLPDEDDTEEEHPWEWLAELLTAHGVGMSADRLRSLPYVVEYSERLLARLTRAD